MVMCQIQDACLETSPCLLTNCFNLLTFLFPSVVVFHTTPLHPHRPAPPLSLSLCLSAVLILLITSSMFHKVDPKTKLAVLIIYFFHQQVSECEACCFSVYPRHPLTIVWYIDLHRIAQMRLIGTDHGISQCRFQFFLTSLLKVV